MRGLPDLHGGLPGAGHGGQLLIRPEDYRERVYRALHREIDLVHFHVRMKETDLDIGVRREVLVPDLVRRAAGYVESCRRDLEDYIAADPTFATTLEPHPVPASAPPIVQAMAAAAAKCGVGPMAAVAGAVAQWVGRALERFSRDVIVENGGDIYLRSKRARTVGIFAGASPFSRTLALELPGEAVEAGVGVCTSSATVGPSLSFGCADAAVIVGEDAVLADAAATALGNRVKAKADLEPAVDYACSISGVIGAVAVLGEDLAAKGRIKLRRI